ncbi:MAG: energy transducer TonB [Gammaproteobacteria bacterium]|nr:energy transducer TonB [Gammaproteobacteria bacterium]
MWKSRQSGQFFLAAALCLAAAGALRAADVPDTPDAAALDTDTERTPQITMIPDYPKVARRDRIEGEVQVCFDITRDGRTRRIAVRKSTHRIFEKPAIRAVRASTYEPLPKDAVMSGIKSCRTFRFTLEPVVKEAPD